MFLAVSEFSYASQVIFGLADGGIVDHIFANTCALEPFFQKVGV